MQFNNPFKAAPPIKVMINIGACMDIPTGTYVTGLRGESILNGGLGFLTATVGIGNQFKSTVLHYMTGTAMFRMTGSTATTYDTEINIHEWHLKNMVSKIEYFDGTDVFDSGRWTVTDKTVYTGDEYYDILREHMQNRKKNEKQHLVKTPFCGREKTTNLMILLPEFQEIDSFSEFSTKDVIKMQDDNSLGDSGGNTISMRQGMQKNRVLMEIPGLSASSYSYILMTAHLGAEFNLDPYNPAPKKLSTLKGNQKIKGAPEKFTFVMNNCWQCFNASPLIHDTLKTPEYPRNKDDDLKGDTDLNVVTIKQLRGKSGPSGMGIALVISQQDGVLPSLTEFHYIKTNGRYGLEGNLQNYYLSILPEVSLSRTTVRSKLDNDSILRRAMNITSEMCQINDLWHHLEPDLICSPADLYKDLKELGYDWELLLNTRGWWALEDAEDYPKSTKEQIISNNFKPFLSTMDLLRMRKKQYVPYWYPEDLKSNLKI